MVKVWFRLIQKGLKTIQEVPEKYRQAVEELIESEG